MPGYYVKNILYLQLWLKYNISSKHNNVNFQAPWLLHACLTSIWSSSMCFFQFYWYLTSQAVWVHIFFTSQEDENLDNPHEFYPNWNQDKDVEV